MAGSRGGAGRCRGHADVSDRLLGGRHEPSGGHLTWSTGAFELNHFGYLECMHGAAELRGGDGTVWKVGPGTPLVIPNGWVETWHVTKPDHQVVRHPPRCP